METEHYEITGIQLFDYAESVQISDDEHEIRYSYSANLIINDDFIVQIHGNSDTSTYDGIAHSTDVYFNDPKRQDLAFKNINWDELEIYLEENLDFKNNIGWLEDFDGVEIMNPENAQYRRA